MLSTGVFFCARACRRGRDARSRISEPAGAEVFYCLDDLLRRIHHERAVLGDRLAERAARDQDQTRRRVSGADPHTVALAEHGQVAAHEVTGRALADPRLTLI